MADVEFTFEQEEASCDIRRNDVLNLTHTSGAMLRGVAVGEQGQVPLLGGVGLDALADLGWTVDSVLRSPKFTPGVYGHPDITGALTLDDLFVATDSTMKHLVTDEDETHAATMDPRWAGLEPLRHAKEVVAETIRAVRLALATDDPTTHEKLDRVMQELGA